MAFNLRSEASSGKIDIIMDRLDSRDHGNLRDLLSEVAASDAVQEATKTWGQATRELGRKIEQLKKDE